MHDPKVYLFRLAAWPIVAAALLAAAPAAVAAADEETSLFDAVGAAVADGRVTQSRILGFTPGKESFTESPSQPGVLTGFDLGVGKFSDSENIYGLRAVFLTGGGDKVLKDHGLFHDKLGAKNKQVKSKVQDVVHIRAAHGYAVGAVTLRSGLNINGLSVTFMRMKDGKLDPQDSYESDWVGDRSGGEGVIRGNGAPVVGIAGNQDNEKISRLGLTFATQPAPAVAPPAVVPPPAAAPPAPQPRQPPAAPLRNNIPPEAPADPPPDPPQAPVDRVQAPAAQPQEPAAAATQQAVAPPSEDKAPHDMLLAYLVPAAAFVAVAGLVLVFTLTALRHKNQPAPRLSTGPTHRRGRRWSPCRFPPRPSATGRPRSPRVNRRTPTCWSYCRTISTPKRRIASVSGRRRRFHRLLRAIGRRLEL